MNKLSLLKSAERNFMKNSPWPHIILLPIFFLLIPHLSTAETTENPNPVVCAGLLTRALSVDQPIYPQPKKSILDNMKLTDMSVSYWVLPESPVQAATFLLQVLKIVWENNVRLTSEPSQPTNLNPEDPLAEEAEGTSPDSQQESLILKTLQELISKFKKQTKVSHIEFPLDQPCSPRPSSTCFPFSLKLKKSSDGGPILMRIQAHGDTNLSEAIYPVENEIIDATHVSPEPRDWYYQLPWPTAKVFYATGDKLADVKHFANILTRLRLGLQGGNSSTQDYPVNPDPDIRQAVLWYLEQLSIYNLYLTVHKKLPLQDHPSWMGSLPKRLKQFFIKLFLPTRLSSPPLNPPLNSQQKFANGLLQRLQQQLEDGTSPQDIGQLYQVIDQFPLTEESDLKVLEMRTQILTDLQEKFTKWSRWKSTSSPNNLGGVSLYIGRYKVTFSVAWTIDEFRITGERKIDILSAFVSHFQGQSPPIIVTVETLDGESNPREVASILTVIENVLSSKNF